MNRVAWWRDRDCIYLLDQVDRAGEQVAFIGSAPDREVAERMRDQECARRGVPADQILLTPVRSAA